MKKDKLFSGERVAREFNFDKETAEVFDDMLERSIPLYKELQRMIGEMANEFAQEGTNVVDLGCSAGTTMTVLDRHITKKVHLVGVDSSQAMLEQCEEKLKQNTLRNTYELIHQDLNEGFMFEGASVVILSLTLQFVRLENRGRLIRQVYNGLKERGCLILVEKVLGNEPLFDDMFTKFYYEMKKRNGYSAEEIERKREALKNVLLPCQTAENEQILTKNGFSLIDIFYKWNNFCGIVAVKE